MIEQQYDKIIIGAGFYGLYSALFCCQKGQSVLVLECIWRGKLKKVENLEMYTVGRGIWQEN